MAILSPLLGEMRGKVGSAVFSRNKGGPYVRLRSTPVNPNSVRQQTTRNHVAWCAVAWASTLSEGQRDAWRDWASANPWINSLGMSVFLTGLDWFTMVNSRLRDAGGTLLNWPGDLSAPSPLSTCSITLPTATTVEVTFTPALAADARLVAWGSGAIGAGEYPNFRQARLIGYSAVAAPSPVTLTMPWRVETGQKMRGFFGVMGANGRVSTMLIAEATKA